MTPELEPIERYFRLVAVATGRPWPPDRWLGAKARALFACMRAEALFAEAIARATVIEMLQLELRETLGKVDGWTTIAEELARVMAQEEGASPWPALYSAFRGEREGVVRRRWVFEEAGRWYREELDASGAWVRRSEDPHE